MRLRGSFICYRVVDAMPIKEIYDQDGTKLQDAPVVTANWTSANPAVAATSGLSGWW